VHKNHITEVFGIKNLNFATEFTAPEGTNILSTFKRLSYQGAVFFHEEKTGNT
jgi:hypothetical protein